MWLDVRIKVAQKLLIFSKSCLKEFLLKHYNVLKLPKKSPNIWPLLQEKLRPRCFKNSPIWSHWTDPVLNRFQVRRTRGDYDAHHREGGPLRRGRQQSFAGNETQTGNSFQMHRLHSGNGFLHQGGGTILSRKRSSLSPFLKKFIYFHFFVSQFNDKFDRQVPSVVSDQINQIEIMKIMCIDVVLGSEKELIAQWIRVRISSMLFQFEIKLWWDNKEKEAVIGHILKTCQGQPCTILTKSNEIANN